VEYRRLGRSGLQVSSIGLGTNNFGSRMEEKESLEVVHHAVGAGINFIDTSNSYGNTLSEQFLGKALKGIRDSVVLATKVHSSTGEGPNQKGSSRLHIMREVENSLKRLQTDFIDLYQMHFWDPNTPIEETLRALDDLVRQGKVRYIGCSNYTAWQTCESIWLSRTNHLESFVSSQPQWSLLSRNIESELVPFCEAYGIGILPYFPLAGGFLTGKYRRGEPIPEGTRFQKNPTFGKRTMTDNNFDVLERLEAYAAQHDHRISELAFAWLLNRPVVSSVIAGASTPDQVDANIKAADWKLSGKEMEEINVIL
jgi:aryl-alcohol dehydrogenase-like predicted oxidoreductase